MFRLGIDEAGRGSLIGPLVVAGVLISREGTERLKKLGIRDSKELTPSQREDLLTRILEGSAWHAVIMYPPTVIDLYNLNRLTFTAVRDLVMHASTKGFKIERIVVDMIGGARRKNKILALPSGAEVIMEVGADKRYVEVSAASILAKVTRDRVLQAYREEYGVEGSGYPSDRRTVDWIIKNKNRLPLEIIRTRWSTLRKYGLNLRRAGSNE
uniref:Ribonuclease n=1 Tax=Fervidicoccus fontis TaxID=683846 RepID=A0A7J3ZLG2_9CREN